MSRDQPIRKLESGILTLPAGIIAGSLYAIACWGARQISLDQFFLPSGIRVAALLISPVRMWPYLLLGEYAYFAHLRLPLVGTYGLDWVLLSSAYQFPIVALIVHILRGETHSKEVRLIVIAGISAAAIGLGNVSLMHAFWESPQDSGFAAVTNRFVLGHYTGILTIAPLAILMMRRTCRSRWSAWLQPRSASALVLMLATGYATAHLPEGLSSEKSGFQLIMALPVIALTCIHGWRGAAVGMPLLNLIVHFTTPVTGLPGSFDAGAFQTQQGLALVSTALLVLGGMASQYRRQLSISLQERRQDQDFARASHLARERYLRARAHRMRHIGDHFDLMLNQMVEWLKEQGHTQFASGVLKSASIGSRHFREQISMVYPTPLEHVGLYLALQGCGIGEEWDKTGRVTCEQLSGDPCQLSTGLQLAAYRTIEEAVSVLLQHESGNLQIRARCGRHGQLQGILLAVTVLKDSNGLSRTTMEAATQNLMAQAGTYNGTLQFRRNALRLVLTEAGGDLPAVTQAM